MNRIRVIITESEYVYGALLLLLAAIISLWFLMDLANAQGAPQAPVAAAPFDVKMTAQDSGNLNQVCLYAMNDATLSLAQKTAVGQYCLDILNRVGAGQQASAQQAAKTEPSSEAPK